MRSKLTKKENKRQRAFLGMVIKNDEWEDNLRFINEYSKPDAYSNEITREFSKKEREEYQQMVELSYT